jgi:hypothetical protein
MNYDQITGIIRAVLPPIVAYAVAKNWLPLGTDATVTGPIITAAIAIAAAVWSVLNNKTGKTIT